MTNNNFFSKRLSSVMCVLSTKTREGLGKSFVRFRLSLGSAVSRFSLASLICLCMLTVGVGNAWGDDPTITLNTSSLGTGSDYASGAEQNATVGTVDFKYVYLMTGTGGNAGKIQAQGSNGEIWNSTVVPGKITNVTINQVSNTKSSTFYIGTTVKTTDNSSSFSTNGANSKNATSNWCQGYFHIKRGSNAAYWSSIVITYTPATITLSESSITGLNYNVGSGPSASQTFTVSGSNIPDTLVVTAPTNFEVSLDGSSWGSSKRINVIVKSNANAGKLTSTTVYVRLAAGKAAGNYSGNVSVAIENCNSSTGVTPKTVAVSGTVTAAPACADPTAPTNSSVSGTGVTISTSSSSANYDIYYSTSPTTPTSSVSATITSGNSKAITGLSYGTTYYYWMRKNCGEGSTSNYVAGSPTSFTTTVPAPTGLSMTPSLNGVTFGITDDNNVNSYEIYYSTTNSEPGASPSGTATTTTKSKTVTGLPASTTYYCWVRAKGPNENSSWYSAGSFATLTLSSISVSTAPTKTKYLVGDNFDPTGLVITRTYSNSTSDTYSYAGHTGDFSFSPATNAALTVDDDAVTITYGGKSVSQSINVYTVTVNKVNMSGTAITNASVTATCSGRTLSQSVGSTNYKFNSWNVTAGGVSVSTNTITGTPTGNVTINAKFHDPITVTWKVGSGAASGSPTTEVKYNTAITALPSTPADNALASCGTNKFMGWSKNELTGTGHDAPADLFTTVGGATNLTTNTTYRAVFANGSGSGDAGYSKVTDSEDLTSDGRYLIVYEASSTSAIIFDGSLSKLDATPDTIMAPISSSFIAASSKLASSEFTIDMTNLYVKSASNIYIYRTSYDNGLQENASANAVRSITIDGSDNLVIEGTGEGTGSNAGKYTVLRYNTAAAGGSTNGSRFRFYKGTQQAIQLYKYDPGTTYSDYQTGCCEAPPALSITSANSVATGGTVSLTSTGGNGGTVTWSVVNGTGTASVAGTTLTAGNVGTVTVKAHQDATGSYCAQDAEQAFTVVSSTVNVTGVEVSPTSKAIVPGETFTITPTISPSNATDKSVSWTSSASDKATVTSGGVVEGVAAGTATITCTTTDGNHTATTTVTVYGVTMQALDEDGNAIAVGGPGTPSRTGTSISPAADAGNYVFKEWAISGASLGSSASTKANTITNPTGVVTVTAKYYKPRTVKWSVNGDDSYTAGGATTTVAYNGTISTVPTDPSGLACASTFVAWTDATHNNGQTAKDDDSYYESKLFTDAGDFPNITAETTTFYAVFAEEVASGTYSDGTSHEWLGSNGYSDWGGSATYSWLRNNGTVIPTHAYTPAYGVKKVVLNVRQSNATGSNTVAVSVGGTAIGTAKNMTEGTTNTNFDMTFDNGTGTPLTGEVRIVATNTSANTTGQGTFYLNSITLYEGAPDVELTDYVTECDPNLVKVTYDANGGATSCANTTMDKTEDFTVCSSAPTRDYYTFAGWLCSADSKTYAASATIKADAIDADFTLTAQWTPVSYSISYNLNGGTNATDPISAYNVETTSALPTPTKGHDRFDGWYTDDGVWSNQVASITAGMHGNLTLYAKWTSRYEIVFDVYGGSTTTIYRAADENLESDVAGQGSKPSNPDAPSTCSTKTFVGWVESEIDDETDTKPATLTNATGAATADKHYYATWALKSGSDIDAAEDNSFTTSGTETYCGMTNGMKDAGDYILKNSVWSTDLSGSQVKIKVYHLSNKTADVLRISLVNSSGTEVVGTDLTTTVFGTSSSSAAYSSYVTLTPNSTVTGYKVALKTKNSNGTCVDKVTREVVASYSKYATSCCATKVTLSENSPSNGTIEFGKTSVGTCGGDKEVSLTITPAAGYQLHSYEVATGSGKVAAKSVSPAISLDNNSSAAQNITLTFAEDANGAYDVTAAFSLMTVTGWTWTLNSEAIPNPLNLYVGQSARLDVAYTPAGVDASKKTYTRTKVDAYINWSPGANQPNYCNVIGRASTGESTTAVTFTHADGPTTTVNVKVLPLPLVHFTDNVHNVVFADVAGTLEANALVKDKTTPTTSDFSGTTYNTCEEQHEHLVGWIESSWADEHPNATHSEIAGAGAGVFYTAGASIDVDAQNGKTFYAVWSKIE